MKILYRYILKSFINTLVFSLVALCTIFLIVNLLDNLDEFLDQKASILVISEYYASAFPEIIKMLMPVAILISTLFTVGKFSSQNEITAMKSGGMSLYKIMYPLAIFCMLLSFGQLYFNGWIVPKVNTRKIQMEVQYLEKDKKDGPLYNLYLRDNPKRNLVMGFFDADEQFGTKISIDEFSSDTCPRIIKKYEAERIQWDPAAKSWRLLNCVIRKFDSVKSTTEFHDIYNIKLTLKQNQMKYLQKLPDQMNFDEFKSYINVMKQGGKDVRKLLIEYYGDYALPFANFIIILFAVPFASIKKRGGIAMQIAAAMVITFTYLVFIKVGQTIGFSMNLEPIISAWMANIIFFIAGLFVIYKTKT